MGFLDLLQLFEMPRAVTLATHFIFMLSVGFYLLQNLQWYNYNIWRTFTKHTKYRWHFIYLVVPFALYFAMEYYGFGQFFCFYLGIHIILLGVWYYHLDKKLVWTNRVKRFFITLTIFLTIDFVLELLFDLPQYSSFVALVVALLESKIFVSKSIKSLPTFRLNFVCFSVESIFFTSLGNRTIFAPLSISGTSLSLNK